MQRLLLSHSQPGFGQGGADLGEFMQVGQLVELQVALLNFKAALSLSLWLSRFGLHSSTLLGWLCSSPLSLRNLATVVGADAVTQLAHLQILALLAACSFGCTPFGPALTTEFVDRLHIGSYKLHSRSRGETATTADVR